MKIGIIGSGSWGTAIAKILTDNGNFINWWIRNIDTIKHIQKKKHNPHYLSTAYFNTEQLYMNSSIKEVFQFSELLVIAVPSSFIESALSLLKKDDLEGKYIVSAIKGILPSNFQLLHSFLDEQYNFPLSNYFTLLGPCHAEEISAEKLSYLTFSGLDKEKTTEIAHFFKTDYLNTIINSDVVGVQYASVLKNIYALGAGIAHGLEYGDNFLSVYIANAAREMVTLLKQLSNESDHQLYDYNSSVYLGDLLVTCYSLYSRNRTFGNMIGKGYSVTAAKLELNMIAEGYYASKAIQNVNYQIGADIPISSIIYEILWNKLPPEVGYHQIESMLI